ncbi:MAG TPA: FAD binding domain-containing protein [Xanthobacteraceae bacterium]|nr:FAD binding domain-containing protein [Xanthobacteraceae bacterium]
MDINTVTEIARPRRRGELPVWKAGDAWLAGGTWLYSEPQPAVSRLIDIADFDWPALEASEQGLRIAATCKIAELDAMACPPHWTAAPLFNQCCRAFLSSFKIWNMATVGGNVCMALPAGPMISLTAALDGVCTIWKPDGSERRLAITDFVLGPQRNALQPGELLRLIELPIGALRRRTAFRQISLAPLGRSAVLCIGVLDPGGGAFALTITASTPRPVKLSFPGLPHANELRAAIDAEISERLYYSDVHGLPAWRRQMTLQFAEEIRTELAGTAKP